MPSGEQPEGWINICIHTYIVGTVFVCKVVFDISFVRVTLILLSMRGEVMLLAVTLCITV